MGQIPLKCASNEEQYGLLCYSACNSGYNGVGPLCWRTCPLVENEWSECGALCLNDTKACVNLILDQVKGWMETLVDFIGQDYLSAVIGAVETAYELVFPMCEYSQEESSLSAIIRSSTQSLKSGSINIEIAPQNFLISIMHINALSIYALFSVCV